MNPMAAVVLGPTLTLLAAYGFGRLMLHVGGVWRESMEQRVTAITVGLPALTLLMFVLAACQAVSAVSCALVSALGALCALWRIAPSKAPYTAIEWSPLGWLPKIAVVVAAVGILCFTALYLRFAAVPDIGFDSAYYHLGFVRSYFENGGFVYYTDNLYAALSQGTELLFLHAYTVGAESAASMMSLSFLAISSAIVYWLLVRETGELAAISAALMVFTIPVLGVTATLAYVDAAVFLAAAGTLWMLERWRLEGSATYLVFAGFLAGFGYSVKYTAFVLIVLVVLYVAWYLRRDPRKAFTALAITGMAASVLVFPWLIRNSIVYGNPAAPFFNDFFPNPYFLVFEEETYKAKLRTYDWLQSWRQLPREWFVGGTHLQGIVGFGFLAMPLALLGLRHKLGAMACVGAILFASVYPSNIGVRFLIPVLVFSTILLAIALRPWPWVMFLIAVGHAISAWPPVLQHLVDEHAWVLREAPRWSDATSPHARQAYLETNLAEYRMAQLVDQHAKEPGKIFAYSAIAEGYSARHVCLDFTSAECKLAGELLLSGIIPGRLPVRVHTLRLRETDVKAIRIRLANDSNEARWAIHELRLHNGDSEIPRSENWRLHSSHAAWLLPRAFDNSLASSWSAWASARQGQFVEIHLDRPQAIDRVTMRVPPDWDFPEYRIEILPPTGDWQDIAIETSKHYVQEPRAPRDAALALERAGFRYLVAYSNDFHFPWLMRFRHAMGLTIVANSQDGTIFRIAPASPSE